MEKDFIRKLCIIGGSSGSLDVLLTILPLLLPMQDCSVIIVLHRKNSWDSLLPVIFNVHSAITIKEAEEKEVIRPNYIYIAPADYHLLVEKDGTLSLDMSEKINFSRPSIDVSMETLAEAYRNRAIGILLSGANADGVTGLQRIRQFGGYTIAQNPDTASVDFMPRQAIERSVVDKIMTPLEMADFLNKK